jgi:hypothetical protein
VKPVSSFIEGQPNPFAAQDHSISPSEFTLISCHEMRHELPVNSLGETAKVAIWEQERRYLDLMVMLLTMTVN